MPPDADTTATDDNLDQIETLFQQSAEEVILAQRELDDELNRAYLSACEVGGHSRLYSIPRVTINFRFGLNITKQKKLFIIPKGDSKLEQHTHQLNFSLDAVPEPPPKLEAADPADEDELPPIYVREPFFLLPSELEPVVSLKLINALDAGLTGSWVSAVPDSSGGAKYLSQKFVSKEIANIMLALNKKNSASERGMVFFRFEGTPTSYLIVRVVGSDANDSVFVLTPGAEPEVVIYSIDGDDTKQIRYEPLHRFIYTIRRWLNGELPSLPAKHFEGAPLQLGLQYLQPFVQKMRSGYVNTLKHLSAMDDMGQPADEDDGKSEQSSAVYYDLANVNAKLSYSLEYNPKAESAAGATEVNFNFSSLQATGAQAQDDEVQLLGSRVLIQATREDNIPRLEIELSTPEFALTGAPREKFLDIASRSVEEIVKAFDKDRRYADFINGETYRRGVVALLSYRGSLKEEFLVIWPGEDEGQSRDFAFTCKLDDDMLDDIEVVMRVNDSLAAVQIGTDTGSAPGADLSGKQYRVFHNFFHAVRIWRARVAKTPE